MSSVTTFGAFTMARLGIYASQKRLDATGNNIANINTEGYTRQTIKQKALVLGGADRNHSVNDSKMGYGTMVTGKAQIRDPYLDIRYRNEQSSVGAMEAKQYGLSEIASVLDEVGGGEDGEGVMEAQFNDLMQMMQNLVTQGAGRDEADTLVREAASSIVNTFHEYANRLETLRNNQETIFRGDVNRVNGILKNIAELNSSIRKSNIYGDDALEQKDERNLLIDELSKYMKISVTTEKEELGAGLIVDKLVIKLANDDEIFAHAGANNATLVDGIYSTSLSIRQVPITTKDGKYTDLDGNPIDAKVDETPVQYEEDGTPYVINKDGKKFPIAMEDSSNFDIDLAELKDLKGNVMEDTYMQRVGSNVQATDLKDKAGNPLTENATADDIKNAYIDNKKLPLVDMAYNDGKHETYEYEAVPIKSNGVTTGWDIICTKTVTSEKVELFDNSLYGSLQAERELLTEQGEYATQKQIDNDTNATAKFGYPYYQHALDSLANKFAEMMNNANQTVPDATFSYETGGDGAQYYKLPPENELTDKIKKLTDKAGNPLTSIADLGLKDSNDAPITTYAQLKAEMKVSEHLTENQQKVLMPVKDGGYFLGEYGDVKGGNLFSNNFNGNEANDPKITAGNISISSQWFKGEVRIITSTEFNAGTTANDNLSHILSQYMNGEFDFKVGDVYPDAASYPYVVDENGEPIQTGVDADGKPVYKLKEGYDSEDVANYEATSYYKGSFQGMLMNTWEIMANDQKTTDEMLTNYNTTSDELYVNRDAVMGVDLNDEAMNMMQYQKSYSAACRFMTTIDELLDKLINGTGRAGL